MGPLDLRNPQRPRNQLFNKAVETLVKDEALDEPTRLERLKALAGVSREWNWPGLGLAIVHDLDDYSGLALLCALSGSGPRPASAPTSRRAGGVASRPAASAPLAGDEEMVDIVASRYATRVGENRSNDNATAMTSFAEWEKSLGNDAGCRSIAPAEAEGNKKKKAKNARARCRSSPPITRRSAIDDAEFSRRASNVLTRIPAYATFNQQQLLRTNDWRACLFVRSLDQYLAVPQARAGSGRGLQHPCHDAGLSRPGAARRAGPRAGRRTTSRSCSARCLRPIHRKTRMAAFDALANAARHDEAIGAPHHARAREALEAARQEISQGRADRPDRAHARRPSGAGQPRPSGPSSIGTRRVGGMIVLVDYASPSVLDSTRDATTVGLSTNLRRRGALPRPRARARLHPAHCAAGAGRGDLVERHVDRAVRHARSGHHGASATASSSRRSARTSRPMRR